MRRDSSIPGNLLLAALGLITAYVGTEIVYRLRLHDATNLTYHIADRPLHEYDSLSGFRFVPDMKAMTATMYQGKPVLCETISVGPYGNLGEGVRSWTDADFKILAFGDSFTAYPFAYHSWTDHIAVPLSSSTGKDVQVMNLGRDGFGLLQIVRLANAMIRNTKADLVLIAFVPADLARARIWRTIMEIDGQQRELVSTQQSITPDLRHAADVLLIEPGINTGWCKRVFDGSAHNESLTSAMHERFRNLLAENLLADPYSFTTPLLFNRIRYGDPYYTIRKVERNPGTNIQSFEQDAGFIEDLKGLLASNIPVMFLLLPGHDDLTSGNFQFNDQEKHLYESLLTLAPGRVWNVLEFGDSAEKSIDSLFLLPYDGHPSERGAEWYGNGIVKAVEQSGNIQRR